MDTVENCIEAASRAIHMLAAFSNDPGLSSVANNYMIQERAKASQGGKGKLGKQLDAQKSQTQSDTLAQSARDNVAQRDADASAQARNWD